MLSANSDSFLSFFFFFFQFGFLLSLFLSLIGMARTSKTMLNKNYESGHPCIVSRNAFSFSLLRGMLALGLLYVAFFMLR